MLSSKLRFRLLWLVMNLRSLNGSFTQSYSQGKRERFFSRIRALASSHFLDFNHILILCNQVCEQLTGEQKVNFYFFKRPERYKQEVLSHSFICLPLPYMEGIILICNIDLYCVTAIFNGTGDMFNR